MALEPLASTTDLEARGIDTADTAGVEALLRAASSAIREAAGATITKHTSTVTVPGITDDWLDVPGWAIRSVEDVKVNDAPVTPRLIGERLWLAQGWQSRWEPSAVTMTVTQGADECPADIVDLCCSLVAGGLAAAAEDYDPKRGVANERVDDYGVGYQTGADELVSPMELPPRTAAWLRARFGSTVEVIGAVVP